VVLLADATVTPAELAAFARAALAALADFKIPQYITVRSDPLPRNAGGKVIKPALRDETPWGPALWLRFCWLRSGLSAATSSPLAAEPSPPPVGHLRVPVLAVQRPYGR
jgi:hypothetical protein